MNTSVISREKIANDGKLTWNVDYNVNNILFQDKTFAVDKIENSVFYDEDDFYIRFSNFLMHFDVANANQLLFKKEHVEKFIKSGGFSPYKPVIASSNHNDVAIGIATNPIIEYDKDAGAFGLRVDTVLWKWTGDEIFEMLKLAAGKLRFSVTAFVESFTCITCGHTFNPSKGEEPCEHWAQFLPFYANFPQIVDNSIIWLGHKPADKDAKILKKDMSSIIDNIASVSSSNSMDSNIRIDNILEVYSMIRESVPTHKSYGGVVYTGEWDADKAVKSLRKWASSDGSGDKDTIDWGKYSKGFAWFDGNDKENFGSYKLPHHIVDNGTFKIAKYGVSAAIASINGARKKVDIPLSEIEKVYNHLKKHYKKVFDKEPPELKSEESIMNFEELQDKYNELLNNYESAVATNKELEDNIKSLQSEIADLKKKIEEAEVEKEQLSKAIKEFEFNEKLNKLGLSKEDLDDKLIEFIDSNDVEVIQSFISKLSSQEGENEDENRVENSVADNVTDNSFERLRELTKIVAEK